MVFLTSHVECGSGLKLAASKMVHFHLISPREIGDMTMVGIFTASDFLQYATSILKEARLRELSLEGSDTNYSWLKTKDHHYHDDVDAYLTELLPVIMKMSPESCTAVAVKLDTVCSQTDLSLSSAHILTTLKTLLREQDSMNIMAGTVKQAKETKNRKVKVHPMLEGREPTVSFVVYSNKV